MAARISDVDPRSVGEDDDDEGEDDVEEVKLARVDDAASKGRVGVADSRDRVRCDERPEVGRRDVAREASVPRVERYSAASRRTLYEEADLATG